MYIAMIEPGSYLEFANAVPFNGPDGLAERGLLNDAGKISGRAQAAVRPISTADFNHILDLGLEERAPLLPRVDDLTPPVFQEEAMPFLAEQERLRTTMLVSRIERDRVFRRVVLRAYDERCAITGLKLINGGGRAEAEAAHIRPVEANGPDSVQNGIALSGTVHWMFDRGLISLSDDLDIMISRQANDSDSITPHQQEPPRQPPDPNGGPASSAFSGLAPGQCLQALTAELPRQSDPSPAQPRTISPWPDTAPSYWKAC